MKKYEAYILIRPDLDESKVDQAIKEFEAIIAKHNGKLLDIDKKGKKRLGYKVKDYRDAHHVLVNAEIDPSSITAMNKAVSLNENILRLLLLNAVEKELA